VDINELVLDEVAINTAVDAIIEQIAAMNDNDGRQLFKSVKRGLELPQGTPNESNSPAVFIWHDAAQYRSDGAQLWFDTATATIDLFVVCYSFNDSDLQAQRERLCAHVLRRLQQPAGGVTTADGLQPGASWEFEHLQLASIDHTSPFKKILEFVPVLPPWYISRISLTIEAEANNRV
jgi:hypothetical protein